MFRNLFGKKNRGKEQPGKKKQHPSKTGNALWDESVDLQITYWTFNSEEKEALLGKYQAGDITFPDLYRLHHLFCMEIMDANGKTPEIRKKKELIPLMKEIGAKLSGPTSPYRSFHGTFWQGEPGSEQERPADLEGFFTNASLSHLGALEVIGIDENEEMTGVSFIPFDELRGAVFLRPSLLKAGMVYFEYGSGQKGYWVPGVYGLTHLFGDEYEQNGSMTTFHNHIEIPGIPFPMAIGLGQQDLLIQSEGGASLTGIVAIAEFMISLSTDDPRFAEKCVGRGMDPEEVRRQFES